MSKETKGLGKFVVGAAIGAGIGLLFAPKKGSELRKDLKVKLDELVDQIKHIDVEEVKKEFDEKVAEIKEELSDLDKEKVLEIAKARGASVKKKAQDLADLAKEKGTPALRKSAEAVLENVIKVSNDALKKLEKKK